MAYGFTYTLPTITGSHVDFPVLLKTADFPSAAIDGTASAINNGGGNLVAYTSSAKTTQLPVEVVRFVSGGSPDAEVWVKIGTAVTSGTIYIEADDIQTAQPAVTSTYGRNAVWSDYEVVYHFNDPASSGSLTDATGNGYTGAVVGSGVTDTANGWNFTTAGHVASNYNHTEDSARTTVTRSKATTDMSPIYSIGSTITDSSPQALLTTGSGIYRHYNQGYNDLNSYAAGLDTRITLTHEVTGGQFFYQNGVIEFAPNYTDGDWSALDTLVLSQGFGGSGQGEISSFSVRAFVITQDRDSTEYDNQNASTAWGTVGAWADSGGGIDIPTTTETINLSFYNTSVDLTGEVLVSANPQNLSVNFFNSNIDLTGDVLITTLTQNHQTSFFDVSIDLTGEVLVTTSNQNYQANFYNTSISLVSGIGVNASTQEHQVSFYGSSVQLFGEISINAESQQNQVNFYNTSVSISDFWTIKPITPANWSDESSISTDWTDETPNSTIWVDK